MSNNVPQNLGQSMPPIAFSTIGEMAAFRPPNFTIFGIVGESGSGFQWVPGSTVTADGVSSVGQSNPGGVAGRWLRRWIGGSTGTTGSMMFFETLADAAAAPGPNTRTAAWIVETDAPYDFVPADATAIDGWTSIGNTGGTNGRWLLRSDHISISPRGVGLDDWPRLNLAMIACAYKARILLRAGAWRCSTPGAVPSGTTIEMQSGVTITSFMASTGGQTNSVFFAQVALAAGTTPITVATVPGNNQVLVTSTAAPNVIIVGTKIYISNGLQTQFYTVIGVAGQTLTLNRPINWVCPTATGVVGVWTSLPTDILIYCNDATITGTGDRVVEINGAQNCHVYDMTVSDSAGQFSNAVITFDVGGLDCTIERCRIRYQTAGSFYGIALESCEASHVVECEVVGPFTYNVAIVDCISSTATRCLGSIGANGVFVGYDGVLAGCFDCSVIGGTYSKCTTAGVTVQGGGGTGAIRTKLIGVATLDNVVGIFLSLQTSTQVVGCSGDSDTIGISVAASSVNATINGYTTRNNNIGMTFANGATGTRLANVTTDTTATYGLEIYCFDVQIHGLVVKAATGRCVYVATQPGASLLVDGFDLQLAAGGVPQHVQIYSGAVGGVTGYVTFRDGRLVNTASCFGFVLEVANVVLTLENVVAVTASNQSGVFANAAGLVRRKGYVDLSVFTTPFAAGTAVYGWGTKVLTGNVGAAVPFNDLQLGEIPKIVMTALGGGGTGLMPVVTLTPHTGFALLAAAGDTSTVAWELD